MKIIEFENFEKLNNWFKEESDNSKIYGSEKKYRKETNEEYWSDRIKVYRTNSGSYWILLN